MKIAIVGTGIAGNVAAYRLHGAGHEITVYEAQTWVGGHTHTHRIELEGDVHHVDTGFIVYNERTYPHFVSLLHELGVSSRPTSMSFSVRHDAHGLEYNGTSLDGLFADRRNVVRPSFLRMLADILRFHRAAPALLASSGQEIPLRDYLVTLGLGARFVDDYLVPMGAAIWSTHPDRMLDFPARFFVRFLHNHGMLTVNDRPTWRVVQGGSARYVERLTRSWSDRIRRACPVERVRRRRDGVLVKARGAAEERFDHVFLACHADEALHLLADPSPDERAVLGALPYQRNEALLHTDTRLLPRRQRARAAWNYHVLQGEPSSQGVALTYDMNVLQGITARETFCVTLNASAHVDPSRVLARMIYDHPLFTPEGVAAQQRHADISGTPHAADPVGRTHYCGAYWRNGFHEDGVVSARMALDRFERIHDAQRALPRVA